jgi:hypothetical protein
MASSSLRTSYAYQMLPSNDDGAVRVARSSHITRTSEWEEQLHREDEFDKKPWKKQALLNLKPSGRRDK